MDVTRINTYQDDRFSQEALDQHGCYLADGMPCEVCIISQDTATITGADEAAMPEVIDAFRFNAPHITRFLDGAGRVVQEFPANPPFPVQLCDLQPSQFFVDEEKLAAVRRFIHRPEDIIIQVLSHDGRYISLDGHTRLYLAVQNGWESVRAVAETSDAYIHGFVAEAQRRGIHTPADMALIPHADYVEKWHRFCDDFFSSHQG